MCSGRVDLPHVFRAFSNGVDGVFIGGCHLGECNYITHGNFHALNMTLLAKRLMERIGLNPGRLRIEFMSAGEGIVFADVTNDFVKEIKELGPLGEIEGIDGDELRTRLDGITKMVPYIKIMKNEKLGTPLQNLEEKDTLFTAEEIDRLFSEMISYYIDPEKCQACMTCARRCPVGAIISAKNQIHIIEQDKCIRCGSCLEACPTKFGAVTRLSPGEAVPPPPPEDQRAVVRKGKKADDS